MKSFNKSPTKMTAMTKKNMETTEIMAMRNHLKSKSTPHRRQIEESRSPRP